MSNSETKKKVPIYFYYLTIAKQKDSKDESTYDISQIVDSFTKMLLFVIAKDLRARKQDNKTIEKVIWLDSFLDLKDGNYDLIFKSAKYNHVRKEIDTETMQELGTRKRRQDGDEEKTHLCIRLAKGQHRFIAVHESNHYGISIKCILDYLNEQFSAYNEDTNDKYHYSLSHEIMPGDDFLEMLKTARTITMLKLIVSKDDLNDEFMRFAGRDEIDDEVEICLKRPPKAKRFPENLIKSYYEDMQSNNKIKRIIAKGTNPSGFFQADTDLIKMKHYLSVKGEIVTDEVDSFDFFEKAQDFIDEMRNK